MSGNGTDLMDIDGEDFLPDGGPGGYQQPIDTPAQEMIDQVAAKRVEDIFPESRYLWQGRLVESDFKVFIENELNPNRISTTTLFSLGCKIALLRVVNAFFDKNTPLSKIDDVNLEVTRLELTLNEAVTAMRGYDKNNPQLLVAKSTIINAYRIFVTRAINGWERGLQNKLEHSIESTQKVVHQMPRSQAPKRGLRALLGREEEK